MKMKIVVDLERVLLYQYISLKNIIFGTDRVKNFCHVFCGNTWCSWLDYNVLMFPNMFISN